VTSTRINYGDPEGLRRLVSELEPIIAQANNIEVITARVEQVITHYRLAGYTDIEIGAVIVHALIHHVQQSQPDASVNSAVMTAMVLIRRSL
jgi:hypothetical protein